MRDKRPTKKIWIKGEKQEKLVTGLLDTGSEGCIVRRKIAKRIKLPDGEPTTLIGAGGKDVKAEATECELKINGEWTEFRVFVVDKVSTDMILGIDYMEAEGYELNDEIR